MSKYISVFFVSLCLGSLYASSEEKTQSSQNQSDQSNYGSGSGLGVSTNPSTVYLTTGTGDIGRVLFKLDEDSFFRLGGVWVADGSAIMAGGAHKGRWNGNNLIVLGLDMKTKWDGGMFGLEFLQFDGMDSNTRAGSVQGYDSLSDTAPFNRSELYEVWFRQSFLDEKITMRIGKTVPTLDFNNVLRPVPVQDESLAIPSVSGLLFTPVFINPVNIGVMPGYYNSAWGIVMNFAPLKEYYISIGAYDGNLARGKQIGLQGPHFNGYYFFAFETGYSWVAGDYHKPGDIAIGGWVQTGKLKVPGVVKQNGAQGVYLFGSQRIWFLRPGIDDSGISAFWQLGYNHGKTLPMNKFVGLGLTAFALTRPQDSFGVGMAWSWLNRRLFTRRSELMFQGYYQAHVVYNTYLEPIITYIPTPGGGNHLSQTWIATLQMINLF